MNDPAVFLRAQAGEEAALAQLVEENRGLVYQAVRRFLGRGIEEEDLVQLGAMGLIKSIKQFDIHYGVQFSTYAVPLIFGEIRRFFRDEGMVHVGRRYRSLAAKARQKEEELKQKMGEEVPISLLAKEMGVEKEELAQALSAVQQVLWLDAPLSAQEEGTLSDLVADPKTGDQEERLALMEGLTALSSREQKLLKLRYFEDYTQTETAQVLGVSQVQVSRLEKKALLRLREKMKET